MSWYEWINGFGQIIIFHQPGFPWNKGISLPYLATFWGEVVWGREQIWPDGLVHPYKSKKSPTVEPTELTDPLNLSIE